MQASSPRKKPLFFCSSILLYATRKKNQVLFPVFIAKIIYNFGYEMIAFCYSIIVFKVLLMF